jgi:nanoRNase/pAp phosphatase (c-di-AMP/oligoRNAs hydrolase)
MEHPFPKSTSAAERCKRLQEVVNPEDILGIMINADPDAMASALALKRLFWRKVRKAEIYHINSIQRADNLALIKFLKLKQLHVRRINRKTITKWALLDSQPPHNEEFTKFNFDIIIDHHPFATPFSARFIDVREGYGANSTILIEYLRAAKIRPSPRLATALFYGIKTDTDNFVRGSLPSDINAFRYVYKFANMNIIKKIESSEMTKRTLASYRLALERLTVLKDVAFVHMDVVENPDVLVLIADFFMKLAEVTWSIVSGTYLDKLIVIFRYAGFRGDAGKAAQRIFGDYGGTAGGHKSAARAEIPLSSFLQGSGETSDLRPFLIKNIKGLK